MTPTALRVASLVLLATASLTPMVSAQSSGACYLPSGKEAPSGIMPCRQSSSANATHCCGGSDYCLSNGLCLNARGSNEITQQGCTDTNWGSGCHKYCPDWDIHGGDGFLYLVYCVTLNATSAGYCCGTDRSCCSVVEDLVSIPLFSEAIRPTTDAQSTSSSDTSSPTSSGGNSAHSETNAGSDAGSRQGPGQGSGITGRIVGLAVGLSVAFFAMIVACVWLFLRHRRQRMQDALAAQAGSKHRSSSASGDGTPGRIESDAEMPGADYKDPMSATAATAVPSVRSPIAVNSLASASTPNPSTTPSDTALPNSGLYVPENATSTTEPDSLGIALGNAAYEMHIYDRDMQYCPQAAEPCSQHVTSAMASEPTDSPLELDGVLSIRSPSDALGNRKYRF